jgi:hypothetical protein
LTLTYRAYVAFGHDAAANSDLQYDDLQQSDQGQTHYTYNVFHHRAARTTELRTPPKRAQRVHLTEVPGATIHPAQPSTRTPKAAA